MLEAMGSESRPSAHLWLAALAAVLHVPATTPAEHSARTGICSALARLSTAPLRPADSSAGTFTEVDVVAERCFASLQKLLEERSEHGARCASELAAACLALLEAGGRVPPAAPPTAQGVVGVLAALRDGLPLPLLRRWFDVPLEKEVVRTIVPYSKPLTLHVPSATSMRVSVRGLRSAGEAEFGRLVVLSSESKASVLKEADLLDKPVDLGSFDNAVCLVVIPPAKTQLFDKSSSVAPVGAPSQVGDQQRDIFGRPAVPGSPQPGASLFTTPAGQQRHQDPETRLQFATVSVLDNEQRKSLEQLRWDHYKEHMAKEAPPTHTAEEQPSEPRFLRFSLADDPVPDGWRPARRADVSCHPAEAAAALAAAGTAGLACLRLDLRPWLLEACDKGPEPRLRCGSAEEVATFNGVLLASTKLDKHLLVEALSCAGAESTGNLADKWCFVNVPFRAGRSARSEESLPAGVRFVNAGPMTSSAAPQASAEEAVPEAPVASPGGKGEAKSEGDATNFEVRSCVLAGFKVEALNGEYVVETWKRIADRPTYWMSNQSYPVVIITWVQYLGPPGPFSFPDSRDLLEVLGGLPWQRETPREDPLRSGRIP